MAASGVLETLKRPLVIADGAMGTMLIARGLAGGGCPELLNVERPDAIREIHSEYLSSGSELILTHSFGANPFKLRLYGLEARTRELSLAAVRNARWALEEAGVLDRHVLVAGDMGPSGQLLEPLGSLRKGDLLEGFQVQAEALSEGGVDLIVVETMVALDEAAVAIQAAKGTGLPVGISFSFSAGARGYRTAMGAAPAQAVALARDEGADIVGANCGEISPLEMAEVVSEMRSLARMPILAEPNAGAPRLVGERTIYDAAPGQWAEETLGIHRAGANIIGGCCGTTPEHIARLRK